MANKKWVADARELLTEIDRIYEDHYSRSYDQCVHDIFNAFRRIVRRHATFGFVEVVRGRWTPLVRNGFAFGVTCSECNTTWDVKSNYCPNCGAKMDGDGNA